MRRIIRCTVCGEVKVKDDDMIVQCSLSPCSQYGPVVACTDYCAEQHIEAMHAKPVIRAIPIPDSAQGD